MDQKWRETDEKLLQFGETEFWEKDYIPDSEIICDMTKINKEMENYCKTFRTSTISQDKINDYEDQLAIFTSNLQDPKLCQDEASEIKHDKTKDELLNALKGLQPGKTPVDDGFTK